MDITIKNVPEEIADRIKEISMAITEDFIKSRDLIAQKSVKDKANKDIDDIREANDLDRIYTVTEDKYEEPEKY